MLSASLVQSAKKADSLNMRVIRIALWHPALCRVTPACPQGHQAHC